MYMTRREFEKLLGTNVKIKLFDESEWSGELHKTGEEIFKDNFSLYVGHKNFYFLTDEVNKNIITPLFRVSYIKKVKQI